jgi:CHAD domain-containing protein
VDPITPGSRERYLNAKAGSWNNCLPRLAPNTDPRVRHQPGSSLTPPDGFERRLGARRISTRSGRLHAPNCSTSSCCPPWSGRAGLQDPLIGNDRDMSSATAVERSRRFEASKGVSLSDVPGASLIDRSRVRLTATYWDTAQRRLLRWGHTLRHHRASDRSEGGWTLRLTIPSRRKKGEPRRAEVDVPGSGLYPPPAIRRLARAVVRRGVLMPIATIITDRRRVRLARQDRTDRIELNDDHVSSVVGLRRGPAFRQIEIEAESPEADGLLDEASHALIHAGAVPTDATKLDIVLGGTPEPEIALPRTGSDLAIRDVVRFAIGSGAERLVANDPAARIGSDPEAIHQARVGTRRLRSDLKTLEPLLDQTSVSRIRDELHWVSELLGSVRDADVLIERVKEVGRALHLPGDATSTIVTELEQDRRRSHAEMVDALSSRRYVDLVQTLVAAAEEPPLADGVDGHRPARPRVRKFVRKSWRRVSRAVKHLGPDPDEGELHEIRKRAKRARYAAELVAAALEEGPDRLSGRLEDLQDVLGELQDAVVAEERLAALVRDQRITGGAAFAAGKLACTIGQAGSDARNRWPAVWKAARAKRLRRWLR